MAEAAAAGDGGWPEPVVRVQALSESGAATIPDRYVRPETERPSAEASSEGGGVINIPVVDLSSSPGTAAAAVAEACREWGFFQAVNHGVSPALLRRARGVWRGFFHQPMEVKQRYANSPATYEGYGSRLGVDKGALLDWGDYYFLHVVTNALYRSVEHRVVVNAADERLSIAAFYNPRSDLAVAPLPELVSPERPPMYSPMTFDDYRLYIRRNGPRGKSQVDRLRSIAATKPNNQ